MSSKPEKCEHICPFCSKCHIKGCFGHKLESPKDKVVACKHSFEHTGSSRSDEKRCIYCLIVEPLQDEGWEEKLIVEVMDDYISCIEETTEDRYYSENIGKRREHFYKLKSFIHSLLSQVRAEERIRANEIIHKHYMKTFDTKKLDVFEKIQDEILKSK